MPEIYDISRTISESTAVWPGDTPFSRRMVMALDQGQACNTSTITLTSHCGTHCDAPVHFEAGAPGIASVDLGAYLGRCRVIHAQSLGAVGLDDVAGLDLAREERLLFRTLNSPPDDAWYDDFAHLTVELAQAAAAAGLKLIGLDTPSVDPMDSKTLDAHHALRSGGVAILENAELSRVPEGVYELIALPLKIRGGDASPVRAVLRPWREPGA